VPLICWGTARRGPVARRQNEAEAARNQTAARSRQKRRRRVVLPVCTAHGGERSAGFRAHCWRAGGVLQRVRARGIIRCVQDKVVGARRPLTSQALRGAPGPMRDGRRVLLRLQGRCNRLASARHLRNAPSERCDGCCPLPGKGVTGCKASGRPARRGKGDAR
jgi:hypothetical protein